MIPIATDCPTDCLLCAAASAASGGGVFVSVLQSPTRFEAKVGAGRFRAEQVVDEGLLRSPIAMLELGFIADRLARSSRDEAIRQGWRPGE